MILRLLLLLIVLAGIALAGQDVAATLAADAALLNGTSAYFAVSGILFSYLWVPLVALAASALFVAPGFLLALGIAAPEDRFEHWLLKGFTFSLFGVPASAAVLQAISGVPMTGASFTLLLVLLCLPGIGLIMRRPDPEILQNRGWDVAGMIVLPLAVLMFLAPKFYWESLNDDGAHSFLNAMLFMTRGLPFWPPDAGGIGGYPTPKMVSETFLQTGFMRLFGPYEVSIRFAYLPGISVLFGVMLSFVRNADGQTDPRTVLGLGGALFLFSFVMAFNPSYNPYFADIALPMAREPMILLGVLGYILFFNEQRFGWMAIVSILALLTAPNGTLLIGFFLISHFLLTRPFPFRQVFIAGLIALSILVLASLVEMILTRSDLMGVADEFGADGILRRLRFVTVFDTGRFLFWLLPCGILPGLALLAWPWQDKLSRTLTLMVVAYVLFFYVQAYRILPHHFAPAAVIPLIVFWRLRPVQVAPVSALVCALAGLAISAWISWPETLRPFTQTRDLGYRISIDTGAAPFPDLNEIRVVPELIAQAFPPVWTQADLENRYMAGQLSVYVHARMPAPDTITTDYFIRTATTPLAEGETVIGEAVEGQVIVARDQATYEQDLGNTGVPVSIARPYRVPLDTIFGQGTRDTPYPVWDIAKVAGLR
ncbi:MULTISPECIES: hypothetical protein [unclassified Ruegeria]|uniref:hypothetical protein n=1 Tax=unclassified Ruegeria TaxID=2625375 RepID=UPI0014922DBD|nr:MULTISPECIES: hypothetical protein [unclassified Ruegeria]NOD36562.1 hypothetical protein [Ruegeria sp. HKCCD7296]NOE43802.1 hypothetical protein [Ruegeria sp. HKCCD7319]